MMSDKIIGLAMVSYVVALVLYLVVSTGERSRSGKGMGYCATGVLWLGFIIHSLGFIVRWIESYKLGYGRIPLTNMYESMVFFSWSIIVLYIFIEIRYGHRFMGIIATLLASLTLALTSVLDLPTAIEPLIPALQSNWLTVHVITCFLGYGAFTIAFGVSLLYLLNRVLERFVKPLRFIPSFNVLDELNHKAIAIGFPMLTLGIFTGAVWAEYAWGTYWSWDPKETWSLITWFVYALFLHLRMKHGWKGTRSAILSIIGFIVVIFTYWGVNYLISGLHSYA